MRTAGVSRVIIRTGIDGGQVPQCIPVDEEYRFPPEVLQQASGGVCFCSNDEVSLPLVNLYVSL